MIMSHDVDHAATADACQVNSVQVLGLHSAMLPEPAKKISDHFPRIWHEQLFHAVQFERARHFAFMTVGIDCEDSNASIRKLFALKAVHGDEPLTFSFGASIGHHEVLTDIRYCDGWKRGLSDFNFHSDFTLSGWGTDRVKLAGGSVNRASRHDRSPRQHGTLMCRTVTAPGNSWTEPLCVHGSIFQEMFIGSQRIPAAPQAV